MDTLQQTLDEAAVKIPALFLENLISKKLKAEGIATKKGLALEIAQHLLSGGTEPFVKKDAGNDQDIGLTLTAAEIDEMEEPIEQVSKDRLPALLPVMAGKISSKTLKALKFRWPNEHAQQEVDLSEFRGRMEQRWGQSLGQLRMLLTMAREWRESAHRRKSGRRKHKKKQLRQVVIRLLVRGCQVTDEIICLLS